MQSIKQIFPIHFTTGRIYHCQWYEKERDSWTREAQSAAEQKMRIEGEQSCELWVESWELRAHNSESATALVLINIISFISPQMREE